MKRVVVGLIVFLSACVRDKTPLTPLGELNVCLRDQAAIYRNRDEIKTWGKESVIYKTANECLEKLNIHDDFLKQVAYRNASALFDEKAVGTSLR